MTKIDQISDNAVLQPGKASAAASEGGCFQTSLKEAMSQPSQNLQEGGKTGALSEPQSTCFSQPDSSDSDVACQTDHLLGLLESYANGLETSGTTLKDLESLVTQIGDGARQLMASTDGTSSARSELKAIAAQTALTANVEYIKFQRGDYL